MMDRAGELIVNRQPLLSAPQPGGFKGPAKGIVLIEG
jgi:hypothetical protein